MFKFLSRLAIAGALLSLPCLGAAPAQATSLATFVSGKGVDSGTCASAIPCRTFQFAIGQTSPGGAVKVLDPANYGAMIITQSISIAGIEGAGINRSAGDAITINAGPNDVVNLTHLTVDGLKTGGSGIVLNSGGSLTITHCTVRNFVSDGIVLQTAGAIRFLIGDKLVSDNFSLISVGIRVLPKGSGSAVGALYHVTATRNGNGINVGGAADVTSVHNVATNNGSFGFVTLNNGVLRLAHTAATGNTIGVDVATGATVESFGDNDIHGNATKVSGTLTPVALK